MSLGTNKTALGTLAPFQPDDAHLVCRWIAAPEDLFWLAPHTPPPLTPDKVLAWHYPGICPFMYLSPYGHDAVGYGEINALARAPEFGWIGHLVIMPDCRRQGHGQAFTRQLTAYGFQQLHYRRIYILVFPQNHAALRCYQSVGYTVDGYESRSFDGVRGKHQMIRLMLRRRHFLRL